MNIFLETIKIVVPGALILYAIFLVIRSFIQKELEEKKLKISAKNKKTVLPLRLQAYERMTVFLERMMPENLFIRLSATELSAQNFQRILLNEIRNEYNHNAAQQIYISEDVWSTIRNAREDLIMKINEAASSLDSSATSIELSKKTIELLTARKVDPITYALLQLKQEVRQLF